MIEYNELKVKFVVHKGEVLALFPTEKATHYDDSIGCYARLGQHSGASKSLMRCKRAKPEQYFNLLRELRSIYENPALSDTTTILKVT